MKTKLMTKMAALTAFVLGAGFALDAAAATPNFAPEQAFGTGYYAYGLTSADLNGDGMPDLIAVNWSDGTISVLMNTASPDATTPSYAPQQTFAVGSGPTSVTAADLNGDGKPDLIVLSWNNGTMTVLMNTTPNGATQVSFAPAQTYAVGHFPQSVAVADINGDGSPDLVVADYGDYQIAVYLNTTPANATQASFADPQVIPVSGGPYALQTVDMNGDGIPDVVVTEFDSAMVSVLLNTTVPGPAATTTVSFAPQQDYPVGDFPSSVAVVDLNGDGLPDLAVTNMGDNTLSVLLNTTTTLSSPSFGAQQVIAVGSCPQGVVTADIDQDGIPDLIVVNLGDNDIMTLQNITSLLATSVSFNQQTFATGSEPMALVITDANDDGQADFATANAGDDTVSVLLNTTN